MSPELSTIGGDQSVEELRRELAEAREQQAATADILRVISSSPMDLQRAFVEIAASAARLCDAYDAHIFQVDDNVLRNSAHHGPIPAPSTLPLSRGLLAGRAVLDQRTIHVADMQAQGKEYPEGSDIARRLGFRTNLAVPLIRACKAIGVISIRRTEVRAFTDRQIELLKTFADQAVIAIENTRLFEAEQESKRELQESLEYQTATTEVLNVISRSPTNSQPVLDAIAASVRRLTGSAHGSVNLFDGKQIHLTAHAGIEDPVAVQALVQSFPQIPSPGSATARAILSGLVTYIPDVLADAEYRLRDVARTVAYRSIVSVPMLREGHPVGAITAMAESPSKFSSREITLLQTFANQAVIAINNAGLFEEVQARTRDLTEALEQQTATADVLKVISRSALDVQKVLDALVESAARLCDAYDAAIFQVVGDSPRLVAHHGQIPMSAPVGQLTLPLVRGAIVGRAVIDRRTIHVADILAEGDEFPEGRKRALQLGFRTSLAVPLVHAGEAIGAIFIRRAEVRPFTERQIELVNTFADQAVIAIENTRLFEAEQASKRELQESLEYQTAISDVLGVIGRSKFDLQPVLTAIVSTACRLCEAPDASIALRQGDRLEFAAGHGSAWVNNEWIKDEKLPIEPGLVAGRAIMERRPIHIRDVTMVGEDFARSRELAIARGHRTTLAVPLLREEEAIGCLFLRRIEVRPFSDKQVALLETFADQAVIAIENVRLFEEIARKSRELEVASQHKSQFVANMSHELRTPLAAILGYAELIQEGFYEPQGPKSLDALSRIRSNGRHLLGLINTVLDIAKIESGQFTLNMSEYAMESVVETVRAATESLAQNKKLTLTTSVDKPLPVGLGDEQRLTQVLLNLVGNAIKFTDAGEVRVTAKTSNGHFNVSVTDTGPGIPLEHQTRIFEQFQQVDNSNTRAKGGTGLGLAIAKQIVEMHGGRIWVESALGKGSTFQVELPTRAEFQKSAP
jgi:signal transduction histidine kinase